MSTASRRFWGCGQVNQTLGQLTYKPKLSRMKLKEKTLRKPKRPSAPILFCFSRFLFFSRKKEEKKFLCSLDPSLNFSHSDSQSLTIHIGIKQSKLFNTKPDPKQTLIPQIKDYSYIVSKNWREMQTKSKSGTFFFDFFC